MRSRSGNFSSPVATSSVSVSACPSAELCFSAEPSSSAELHAQFCSVHVYLYDPGSETGARRQRWVTGSDGNRQRGGPPSRRRAPRPGRSGRCWSTPRTTSTRTTSPDRRRRWDTAAAADVVGGNQVLRLNCSPTMSSCLPERWTDSCQPSARYVHLPALHVVLDIFQSTVGFPSIHGAVSSSGRLVFYFPCHRHYQRYYSCCHLKKKVGGPLPGI